MAKKEKAKRKRKFTADVYLPLVMGDWLRQTSGMKAEARGVFLKFLIHQWDNGFIPSDGLMDIDHEYVKVWPMLCGKFEEVSPGKLQNMHLEEVRDFFRKQKKNAKKSTNVTPNDTPNVTPEATPNTPPHIESDSDIDYSLKNKKEPEVFEYTLTANIEDKLSQLDEIYLEQQKPKWPHLDFEYEYRTFCEKVRGSPEFYADHNSIRLAFQKQLRESKNKVYADPKNRKQQHTTKLANSVADTYRDVFNKRPDG